jgi:hypothetical protein
MIFENPTAKTVILSARKCGLITLGATVTKPGTSGVSYKNRSASLNYIFKSLDPWVEDPDLIAAGKIKEYPEFDKSSWKDYDVTLFVREPYERYISGLVTCWLICWKGDAYHVKDYDKWADDDFYRAIDYYMEDNFKDWLINEDLPQHVEQAGMRILNNIVNFMMKEDKSHKWDWFCEYTRQLDKLRSQSIADIVPHYERYFKE